MTTALALNAAATILSGGGLAENPALISSISSFQNLPTVELTANIFTLSTTSLTGAANLGAILDQLGSGVNSNALWLLDYYPPNVTAVSNNGVGYIVQNPNIGYIPSYSKTLTNQAAGPFSHGMSGFANVFQTTYGYASLVFEPVASLNMLAGKTYAQSGLGFTGPASLATNGLNTTANLVSSTISTWGTMYDVTNISLIADPYVFGKNLLAQGLGTYGNLSTNLTAAGLDVTNLTQIPASVTTVTNSPSTVGATTKVGKVYYPTLSQTSTTTVVTGANPNVVVDIYSKVTGSDLNAIINATGFTTAGASVNTLADFLDFTKVIPVKLQTAYTPYNVGNLNQLGSFVNSLASRGYFTSWTDIANSFGNIAVPNFASASTSATTGSSLVLGTNTVSSYNNYISYGTGPFNNPVMSDFLGAAAGMPHTGCVSTLVNEYNVINPVSVVTALTTLQTAVEAYVAANLLMIGVSATVTPPVVSGVAAVNTALNGLTIPNSASSSYYTSVNKLTTEYTNLNTAGATFLPSTSKMLFSFAQNISGMFSDNVKIQTGQVMANLITNDANGDTIRAAIAESINTALLTNKGITMNNDPNPSLAVANAQAQNIPLSTYLSQNK